MHETIICKAILVSSFLEVRIAFNQCSICLHRVNQFGTVERSFSWK